jgi:3-hydroxyisobutyrate dehydrogenase-like beta-hydroxyacid dehydrogenase
MKVGYVGLGDQGSAMARRILAAGWPLAFYARRPEVVREFEALGATPHPSVEDLGRTVELVLINVVDDDQVRDVVLRQRLLEGMAVGSIVAVHSTVHPETCRQLASAAEERGVTLIDAPFSGSGHSVETRAFNVLVGGDQVTFERVKPVLESYGGLVRLMGPLGSGQLVKLINNCLYQAHVALSFEAVSAAAGLGLDLPALAQMLPNTSGASSVLSDYARNGFQRLVPQHKKGAEYMLSVGRKDARLFREVVDAAGIEMPVSRSAVDRALEIIAEQAGRP